MESTASWGPPSGLRGPGERSRLASNSASNSSTLLAAQAMSLRRSEGMWDQSVMRSDWTTSTAMLDVARQRAAEAGAHAEFQVGDAQSWRSRTARWTSAAPNACCKEGPAPKVRSLSLI